MPVEYRTMHAGEEEAVLALWSEVWRKDGDAYFERYFNGDPYRRPEHTCIAVDGGSVLSAVHVCLRDVRDADGVPRRVGCIANVATRKEARKLGHSGRLLRLSIPLMEAEACAGSLLYTGTNRHYARHGWRSLPVPFRQGTLNGGQDESRAPAAVGCYDPAREPEGWDRLAAVYAVFNARRPLTVVRSPAYWRGFGARAFTDPGAFVLVTEGSRSTNPTEGYLLGHLSSQELRMDEIGWRPGAEESVPALIAAAADRAVEWGIRDVTILLPFLPVIAAALDPVLSQVTVKHHHAAMVREVDTTDGPFGFEAAFTAPGAIFWGADGF